MTDAAPARRTGGLARLVDFVRFLATGAIAAVANLIARYLLDFVMPFEAAVILAYMVGMVIAFLLFQKVIFGDPGTPLRRRIWRFTVVNLIGAALAWIVSTSMARLILPGIGWTFRPFEVAHLVGVAAPAFSSYWLHKYYTFR
jgi:putative flippase GtrA